MPDYPELTVMGVGTRKPDGQVDKAIYNRGGGWHTDSPWDTEICKGTQLYGIAIPSRGGDTLFASMYEAYESLPEGLKKRIDGLKAEHAYGGRARKGFDLLEPEDRACRRRCIPSCAPTRRPAASRSTPIPPTSCASRG